MSHDTDKLIRQLSLVAFLMAERRPLTARDVKQNVEGYSEMSDEAFARRYYSDRAELIGLGVPLQSQRDEFTGEELYTLRSEQYFLPPLELSDDELKAKAQQDAQEALAAPLEVFNTFFLAGRPFIGGDHPSIADIRVAATLEFLRVIDYPFPAWAEDYMARMEETLGDAYSEPVADVRGYVESMKGAAV